jgi:hypothetical protein
MRLPTLAGIGLIVVGVIILLFGGSFTTRENVMEMGGITVTAEERNPILPWVGGIAVIAGIGLVVVGARRQA